MEKVNHPKHYNSHPNGIECIDIIRHYVCDIANAIKYLWRAGLKAEMGMLDKVIEITAIQSQQIKHLALVALLVVQSSDFDGHVADMMIKMGRGEEALKAMFDAKLKGKQ